MAAPQTHLVVTFGFRAICSFIFGIVFTMTGLFWVYFWGCLMDFIDHFTSPSFTKDVFFVRIPRFFRGGAVGAPSKGIKIPVCWLHIWPGLILSVACGLVFFPRTFCWIPLFFWLQHILIDRGQKNDGNFPDIPFLYPFKKKIWGLRNGYPIKSRKEILVCTALSLLVVFFEIYNFLK